MGQRRLARGPGRPAAYITWKRLDRATVSSFQSDVGGTASLREGFGCGPEPRCASLNAVGVFAQFGRSPFRMCLTLAKRRHGGESETLHTALKFMCGLMPSRRVGSQETIADLAGRPPGPRTGCNLSRFRLSRLTSLAASSTCTRGLAPFCIGGVVWETTRWGSLCGPARVLWLRSLCALCVPAIASGRKNRRGFGRLSPGSSSLFPLTSYLPWEL